LRAADFLAADFLTGMRAFFDKAEDLFGHHARACRRMQAVLQCN